MKAKVSELRKNYFLPRDLARMIRCPEKKIREYCKQGKIKAEKTPGGQWRVRKPLSKKTRAFLGFVALRVDYPWIGKTDAVGEFDDSDDAQGLLEAILYGKAVGESIPPSDEVDVGPANRTREARIQSLIWEKIKNGKSLSPLILKGWVYQFWLKEQRRPKVCEILKLMQISRSKFYDQGHSAAEIKKAYDELEPIRELRGPVQSDFDNGCDDLEPED